MKNEKLHLLIYVMMLVLIDVTLHHQET